MKQNKWFRWLACLLILCVLAAGCTESDWFRPFDMDSEEESVPTEESVQESAEESSPQDSDGEPVYGGTISMAIYEPESLDPAKVTRADTAQLLMMIYAPLLETDANGQPSDEGLADRFSIIEDGYTVQLHIRDKVKWSDGRKVTAMDALFSIRKLAGAGKETYWYSQLQAITGAAVINDSELTVTFSSPVDEKRMSMLVIPVLPAHIFQTENPPEWTTVGCGPFLVRNYHHMMQLDLVANNQYYGGIPYLDGIRVNITRSADAAETAFIQGLSGVLYEQVPTGLSTDNIYHHAVYQTETQQLTFLYMNQKPGMPFASQEMRQALMYAVNAGQLVDRTQVHQGTVSESVVPEWLAENGLHERYGQDLQKAFQLLGDHKKAELTLVVNRADQTALAQAKLVYSDLSDIGLTVHLVLMGTETLRKTLEKGNFDLAFGSLRIRSHEDLSALLSSKGEYNYSGREDTVLDHLLESVATVSGREQTTMAYQALARYTWETLPVCPLYYSRQAVIVSRDLGGQLMPTPYHIYRGIEQLYLKQ